jgi:5-methylcytosine-specific restriction endonuclease McrA
MPHRRASLVVIALVLLTAQQSLAGVRSAAERAAFMRQNPCPETGQRRGACPGWEVDHLHPLCAGGPDHRSNMQWLTVADHKNKTRLDRFICRRQP